MDFSKHLFHCSSLGYIMSDPKGGTNLEKYNKARTIRTKKLEDVQKMSEGAIKGRQKILDQCEKLKTRIEELELIKDMPTLSDSCKTHLCDLYTVAKYGRHENIKSKYLEKGLHMEEDAITLYGKFKGGTYYEKNQIRLSNEFITGEMDFEDEDGVINDTKVNWSIFQFVRVAAKKIKPLYWWQLDGYMWLWGKKKARLIYALLDTPQHLIKREEVKLMYELFGSQQLYDMASTEEKDLFEDAKCELTSNHTYGDIPLNERIRLFEVEYDQSRIDKIEQRVKDCRWFLQQLENGIPFDDEEMEEAA